MDGPLDAAIELLRAGKAEVYASSINSGQSLEKRLPGAKIVGAFHSVPFAVTMQKGLSAAAQARLLQLINEAKASGLVRKALEAGECAGRALRAVALPGQTPQPRRAGKTVLDPRALFDARAGVFEAGRVSIDQLSGEIRRGSRPA